MRINHSPKQALLSLHWTSSLFFYRNTYQPWGAWATCPLKALVVTFLQEASSDGIWEECIDLCLLHWGTSVLATQIQRKKFQSNLFTRFLLCTPSWIPPSIWGTWVCVTQHVLSSQLTCIKTEIFSLPLLSQNSTFFIISIYKLVHFTFFFFNNGWLPHYIGNNL